MRQFAADLRFATRCETEVRDLTVDVARAVRESAVTTGQALVFTMLSTSAVTTLEFGLGLAQEDLPAALERLFSRAADYGHERRWRDGNGRSHVRAAPEAGPAPAGGRAGPRHVAAGRLRRARHQAARPAGRGPRVGRVAGRAPLGRALAAPVPAHAGLMRHN